MTSPCGVYFNFSHSCEASFEFITLSLILNVCASIQGGFSCIAFLSQATPSLLQLQEGRKRAGAFAESRVLAGCSEALDAGEGQCEGCLDLKQPTPGDPEVKPRAHRSTEPQTWSGSEGVCAGLGTFLFLSSTVQ